MAVIATVYISTGFSRCLTGAVLYALWLGANCGQNIVAPRWKMRWRMQNPSLQRLKVMQQAFYFLYYKTTGLLISQEPHYVIRQNCLPPPRWCHHGDKSRIYGAL